MQEEPTVDPFRVQEAAIESAAELREQDEALLGIVVKAKLWKSPDEAAAALGLTVEELAAAVKRWCIRLPVGADGRPLLGDAAIVRIRLELQAAKVAAEIRERNLDSDARKRAEAARLVAEQWAQRNLKKAARSVGA